VLCDRRAASNKGLTTRVWSDCDRRCETCRVADDQCVALNCLSWLPITINVTPPDVRPRPTIPVAARRSTHLHFAVPPDRVDRSWKGAAVKDRSSVVAPPHQFLAGILAMTAGDAKAEAPLLMRWIFLPLLFKHVIEDKDRGEKILFACPIDYVNVRPGRLLDKPAKGGVKASLSSHGLQPRMNREDLALFMIAQLRGSEWVRKSPRIGY
jgi:NAD(P)H-binding